MSLSFLRKTFCINSFLLSFSFTLFAQQHNTDTVQAYNKKSCFKKYAVPAALIVLGTTGSITDWGINTSIRNERNKHYSGFNHNADNYLQYAPIPVVYAMDAIGLKAKHNWKEQTVLLFTAEVFMNGMVQPLKRIAHKTRPDSTNNHSFPSGHTAQAFLAASFFNKEYGCKYPLLSAGMYTVATTVGVFRILNNKHWVSDVLAGAGFGMLSVELSYLFEKKIKKLFAGNTVFIMPSYQNGAIACSAFVKL